MSTSFSLPQKIHTHETNESTYHRNTILLMSNITQFINALNGGSSLITRFLHHNLNQIRNVIECRRLRGSWFRSWRYLNQTNKQTYVSLHPFRPSHHCNAPTSAAFSADPSFFFLRKDTLIHSKQTNDCNEYVIELVNKSTRNSSIVMTHTHTHLCMHPDIDSFPFLPS